MVKTILPAHKNAIQKALDILMLGRLEGLKGIEGWEDLDNAKEWTGLDLSVISILPLTCPAQILPHLAESFDVDISGLDEAQTRELLQDAFKIHYYAGTPYSIKRALQIVFKEAGIEEWQEYEGNPYYFRITVTSNPDITGITQQLLDRLVQTAKRYKNARSLIEVLRLNAQHKGNIYAGGVSLNGIKTTIYPQNSADIVLQGNMYIALTQQSAHSITIKAGDE